MNRKQLCKYYKLKHEFRQFLKTWFIIIISILIGVPIAILLVSILCYLFILHPIILGCISFIWFTGYLAYIYNTL